MTAHRVTGRDFGSRHRWRILLAGLAAAAAAAVVASASVAAAMVDNSHRSKVAGIDLITYQTGVKDVIVILGSLPAGDAMAESGNIAIPTLTGMMLDRGTQTLDKFQIADRLDNVGAQISFGVGTETLEIRAKCLKKDLPLVLGLIAAELRTPALSSAEFAKARQQFVGTLQSALQNTGLRAQQAFGRAVFPENHPNHPHTTEEYIASAQSAELGDVKSFHARYFGPSHMTLVLAGDVPTAEARREVAKDFRGWAGGHDYERPAAPASASPAGASRITVPLNDKPSASVMLGQATGLRYRDPDALPLRVGTAILGRGFTGRLMGTVRDREGLTYNIGAAVGEDSIIDGDWAVSASFAPSLLERGIASTRRVIETWWTDGVTDAELSAHKQGLIGSYRVSLATAGGVAGAILASVQRGYDLAWLDGYPQAIEAVTREQVNRAIRAHLDPNAMVLVEAGSVAAAEAPPASPTPTGAPPSP
ncbi:MAG: pitrilysin family protein [Steroidobacteraceae bacterium]|jgi:zinc protease